MIMTSKKLGVIHIAKKQLALSEEDYRGILQLVGGVESAKDLSEHGFEAVMFHFCQLGFRSTWNRQNLGYRPGMASPRQVAMIRKLWGQFTEEQGTEQTLSKWLDHKFHISSVRFLDSGKAHLVVGALKRMTSKDAA